ncbi:hypothetical protein F4805DRAFT_462698 [Annulohypoxylon moriforme]|nr:hypothetical protein F4805DRAFT_462698 [Annulohypoxylon moriforme]
MSDSVDPKANNDTQPCDEADFTNDEPAPCKDGLDETDYQAAYTEQFNKEEEDHWADSYGDGNEEPPTRGGQHMGTVKTKQKEARQFQRSLRKACSCYDLAYYFY